MASLTIAAMTPSDLADWLLEQFGCDYQKDIETIKNENINGGLLNESLEKLDLSGVFKELIRKKLQSSEGVNTYTPDNGTGPTQVCLPLCTTGVLDEDDLYYIPADTDSTDTLSGWVPDDVIWKDRTDLSVKFLTRIPDHWTYDGSEMNTGNIMSWANLWHHRGDGIVPKFTRVRDQSVHSDIRVKFETNGHSRSKVGNNANKSKADKPTMWLNLHMGNDDYKQYVVVHEFGHALGLGHEHQRCDFWKRTEPYIDKNKMMTDLGVTERFFDCNWGKDESSRTSSNTKYDPKSVMHYPFKKEWLKDGYSNMSKLVSDSKLGEKTRKMLIGIHEQNNGVVTEPSNKDLEVLKYLYGNIKKRSLAPDSDRDEEGCLQKSTSTSDAQAYSHSESSPGSVSTSRPNTVQHVSTQVSIPEENSLSGPKNQQNLDTVLDSSTAALESLDIDSKSSYEYLDLSNMTDLEKRTLKGRLTKQHKRITRLYSELNQFVIKSLEDRSISPKQLSRVLMNLSAFRVQMSDAKPLLADNLDSIRGAEDVDDVFYILRSYGSFFDCHVVKHIVSSDLCTDNDRKELEKYESELKIYCQRSVFECPHIGNDDPKFQKFVIKVDDVVLESSEMKAIDSFRVELAEACDLRAHTLHLHSVERGCLELTFQIPPSVVDGLFPLPAEKSQALKLLGVMRLRCGDYSLDLKTGLPEHQPPNLKNSDCAWHKLFGKCNYGDKCRYKHDIAPVTNPAVGDVPDFATLESLKQIPPVGYSPKRKAYVIAISQEEMKIIAEDEPTLLFAQTEVSKLLQSKSSTLSTRLKYSYVHPDVIESPVLYLFKKRDSTLSTEYELCSTKIKPKIQAKKMTVESFDHMTRQHITPAYSRLHRHKKNVYPLQLRRDYREDIHEQLKQSLTWMYDNGLVPLIEGRFGKFIWRKCVEDDCFNVEKLVSLTKEEGKLKYYTFNTEFDNTDVSAIKKICGRQLGLRETYTLYLNDREGSDESYRVQVEFDQTGKQTIVFIRKMVAGSAKVQVLLDVLTLHRKYDIRVSLCSVEKVNVKSVQSFISSAVKMPEPGVIDYDPMAAKEKWCVTYIRHQLSQKFSLKDLYTVDISSVGQYQISADVGDLKRQQIIPKDFKRRCEVELHCDSWTSLDTSIPSWTPDAIMNDFEQGGFLQTLEELNESIRND